MRQLLTAIALTVFSVAAHSGPFMDKFSRDIKAYLDAQSANPNKVIKYADEQGELARAVLNPQRMTAVMSEAQEEIHGADQLKALLETYKPVTQKYAVAFEQLPGKYDEEYLDSFETLFQLTLASMKPLKKIKLEDIKDEAIRPMFEAAIKMATAMPALFLKLLEKQVEDGKFSESFSPAVNARIQKLRLDAAAN